MNSVTAYALRLGDNGLVLSQRLGAWCGHAPELEIGSPGGKPAIHVLDRGPGIPPEEAERVKRPFTRLESARSNTKGSGLGLAIVDRSVRGQKAEFRLAARPGGGLDACIELPAAPKT